MLREVVREIERQHRDIRIQQRGPVATFADQPLRDLEDTFRDWIREEGG